MLEKSEKVDIPYDTINIYNAQFEICLLYNLRKKRYNCYIENMTKKEKALKKLDHLERIYDVYEAAKGDFVDVIG